MSVQVSYKKQTIFGLILLLVILFSFEGLATVYDYLFVTECHFTNSEAVNHLDISTKRQICYDFRNMNFVNSPFRTLVPNQHFPTLNVNEDGFRGAEIKNQNIENSYRIFVVGGSTTFGTGSTSDDTTIPGFLQKKFNSANLSFEVEVINAGVSGGFSTSESLLVKEKLIDYDPDLLIIYDGWNDVKSDETQRAYATTQISNSTSAENNFLYDFFGIIYSNTKTRGIISSILFDIDSSMGKARYPFDNSEISKNVNNWKENWIAICELGKEKDFEVLLTIQPIPGSSNRTLSQFAKKFFISYDTEKVLSALGQFANELQDLEKYCSKTADLRNVFDGIETPLYTDYAHISDFGNEIVAQKLFELSLPIVKNYEKQN